MGLDKDKKILKKPKLPIKRQALHAFKIDFKHPTKGDRLYFEAPLPKDMTELVDYLREGGAL